MEVKFLDLKSQYLSIKPELDTAIQKVIDNTAFALGPAVNDFENDYAAYCGAKYCLGVDSGTSALFMILKALGIGPGDEVITAANTFIATAASIYNTGARPVLVDIDPRTRNINPDKIEAAISPSTRAIMPVHLYGSIADMKAIGAIARKHGLIMIEDAAQAQGAKLNGKPAGSFGLAAGFSFYPGKNLGAYGEAGAVVTSDDDLYERIKKLRDHGSSKKYYHDMFGFNTRMHGIQGAVLGVKLKHLDDWNNERNRVAEGYRRQLADTPVGLPEHDPERFDVYHQFVIEVDDRDKLQAYLSDRGVQTLIHYPVPIHRQKAYIDIYGEDDSFPVTERLAGRILSLPIYPELTGEMVDYVSSCIKGFYQ